MVVLSAVNMRELPTYVMFQNGNEVSRLPDINNDDGKKFINPFSEVFSLNILSKVVDVNNQIFLLNVGLVL